MQALFHRVLLVCDESGLIGKEHFAIDGCKLPTDASKEWSGTHSELKKKSEKMRTRAERIVAKHIDADSGKNEQSGHRKKEEQMVGTLLKNDDKIDCFLENNEKRIGHSRSKKEVQSNITDNESCKMTTSKGTIQGIIILDCVILFILNLNVLLNIRNIVKQHAKIIRKRERYLVLKSSLSTLKIKKPYALTVKI